MWHQTSNFVCNGSARRGTAAASAGYSRSAKLVALVVEAEDRRKKRDEKVRQAARAIQENWRRKKMAQRAEIAATARRARIERRRESRRASSRPRDIASAGTPASANFTGQERPGAEWLERNVQEVLVSEQEAADNERPGLDWLARVMNEAMSQDEDDRDLLR